MTDQGHQRLRTGRAADYVGYAESTLEKKRLTGDGPPFIRLGRAIVYDPRDLDAWLAARRATSTSDQPASEWYGPDRVATRGRVDRNIADRRPPVAPSNTTGPPTVPIGAEIEEVAVHGAVDLDHRTAR